MRKALLVAITLLVIASSAMAAPIVISTTTVNPLDGTLLPQAVAINPATEPVFDPITGQPVIDPLTGLQATRRTWKNYMYFATPAGGNRVVHLQGIILEKIIPERKVACGAAWNTAPNVVIQQGIQDIQTTWPLLYEVDGVEIRLTVTYTTDLRLAYPSPPFPVNVASRSHVEVYKWIVRSNDASQLFRRLAFFSRLPAGTCETFALTPSALAKYLTFFNGYGSPALGNYYPGIAQFLAQTPPNKVQAAERFAALEAYIDSVCVTRCDALYLTGININTPDPRAEAILDNPTVPAASLLLNDLWAYGKALNVLIEQ